MENKILVGQEVKSKSLNGTFRVLELNYDGSCVIVDRDGKHTYTVSIASIVKVGE